MWLTYTHVVRLSGYEYLVCSCQHTRTWTEVRYNPEVGGLSTVYWYPQQYTVHAHILTLYVCSVTARLRLYPVRRSMYTNKNPHGVNIRQIAVIKILYGSNRRL